MSIRPWVVVEAPDDRGLRRVTLGGRTVGSAWSLRELRSLLDRLGHPDVDVADPAAVYWRGGDSGAWPDRAWRRRTTMVVMTVGLLASMTLNMMIGWPDASGALTFAQRITGALFVLSGVVQGLAAVLTLDHWGRREFRTSGAVILLGALIALATDSLLILLWLEEKEYTPYLLAFMPLWCWSLWAVGLLLREKPWKGLPQPRKFAAGVFVSGLLATVSLAYSTLYQPSTAPMRLTLQAEFGTAREDRAHPFAQVPLKLSVKNTGDVSVYVIINDFSVYGRTAKYSERGDSSAQAWKESFGQKEEEAERHVDRLSYQRLSTGRFYDPGDVLAAGQEDTREHVFEIPRDVPYDLLHVDLQITYMRKDRGRIDVENFGTAVKSWQHPRYSCWARECPLDTLAYHGRVHHNNNLVNVTRKPLYVTAFWSPAAPPVYSVSSYHFTGGWIDYGEERRELNKFGITTRYADAEVSVAELLRSISARPR
ncbi:Yip1 family protein [Streptomyces sp. NBC_00847]|uniref:Yip1 family protein n=1 Tax=unclassified Streptomyces TaxID=2593676 RepID=UPI00224CE76D|nr:Yip1 family protein [Streptomyces sp. NBC_00847]MCX4880325.1 YIP1 family protein [Streptomyces sp. NBC_00847]